MITRYFKHKCKYRSSLVHKYFAAFSILLFKLPVIIVVGIGCPSTLSNFATWTAAVNRFDEDVTKSNLASSFQKLSAQVEADDVFVFYIAGYGTTYEDGDYYYLPSDFRYTGSESIAEGGISKNDFTKFLSLIKAGKTLILLDTCQSGAFLSTEARGGLTEKTAIDRLTRATGHATIAASSDLQDAMEGYNGHGIFTYTVVEGLSGKADADNDGFITLQELSAYTETEVPRRSYEKWGYEQIPQRDLRRQDFPIYTRKE